MSVRRVSQVGHGLWLTVLLTIFLAGCPQSKPVSIEADVADMVAHPVDAVVDSPGGEETSWLPETVEDVADMLAVDLEPDLPPAVDVPQEALIAVLPEEICQDAEDAMSGCQLEVDPMDVPTGGILKASFTLRNPGSRVLSIASIAMENYELEPGAAESEPALSLEPPSGFDEAVAQSGAFCLAPFGSGSADLPEEAVVTVVYTKPDGPPGRLADVVIKSDAANAPELILHFTTLDPVPALDVAPLQISFANVPAGEKAEENLKIINIGGEMLIIDSFSLTGPPSFSVEIKGDLYPAQQETGAPVVLEPAHHVPPFNGTYVVVRYESTGLPEQGLLTLFSNDPNAPEGTQVPLTAGQIPPCLSQEGYGIHFGGKKIGTEHLLPVELDSCGPVPVDITAIYLTDKSSSSYTVDYSALDHEPTPENPVTVPPGETVTVWVKYAPDTPSPLAPDGTPILD